jgi:lipopolysaccharide transport system ATP-binding protein
MSNFAINIENLSKQYRLGIVGTGTLSHDLNRWWHLVRGKDDPYLKVGQINDRENSAESDYVWALKDVNLEVNKGEILGVIGKNGAGKSTLLKILSKVTGPTTGKISINGRLASLLEVGTGFHPELTGRENVYLNGAILGMTKKEITGKFDEIVDFAGVAKYIDTPVKRYSSGMMVRLGFAVAAHLEPDVLVVDEVLAVGDAEFQKKAIGKMHDVSNEEGRTILFVSHNMAAVKQLCTRVMCVDTGMIVDIGNPQHVIKKYMDDSFKENQFFDVDRGIVSVASAVIKNKNLENSNSFSIGDDLYIELVMSNAISNRLLFEVEVVNANNIVICHILNTDSGFEIFGFSSGDKFQILFQDIRFYPGEYYLNIGIFDRAGSDCYNKFNKCLKFTVTDGGHYTARRLPQSRGLFFLTPTWCKK